MRKKNKFLRKCIVCSEYKNKNELNRLTKNFSTSEILVNNENKILGRSFYICKDEECVKKALNNKHYQKYFKTNLNDEKQKEIYNKLIF